MGKLNIFQNMKIPFEKKTKNTYFPYFMDSINSIWWPPDLKEVTLYSNKNNNHSQR
jgi:hypothetical protein